MTSNRLLKNRINIKMTPEEQEIFASLNFKSEGSVPEELQSLHEEQKKLAARLSYKYQFGSKNRAVDLEKAAHYDKIACDAKDSEISYNQYLNTGNVHWLMGWFTSIRLFLLRTNKISIASGGKAFLPGLYAIGGFSYAITFLIDVIEVLFLTFYPEPTETEELDGLKGRDLYWHRFKNLFIKDKKRLSRMLNDAFWFAVNLTVFIITGGAIAIINIVGFAFDLLHEVVISAMEYEKYEKFLIKIKWEIEVIRKEFDDCKRQIEELEPKIQILKSKNNFKDKDLICQYEKRLTDLRAELEEKKNLYYQLGQTANKIEEKKIDAMNTRLRIVTGTAIAFFGMLLILFPPTMPLGISAMVIGSSMALFGGSVMIGLGKRLYDLTQKCVSWVENKLKAKSESQFTEPILKNSQILTTSSSISAEKIDTEKGKTENNTVFKTSNSILIKLDSEESEEKVSTTSSYKEYLKTFVGGSPPVEPSSLPNPSHVLHLPRQPEKFIRHSFSSQHFYLEYGQGEKEYFHPSQISSLHSLPPSSTIEVC